MKRRVMVTWEEVLATVWRLGKQEEREKVGQVRHTEVLRSLGTRMDGERLQELMKELKARELLEVLVLGRWRRTEYRLVSQVRELMDEYRENAREMGVKNKDLPNDWAGLAVLGWLQEKGLVDEWGEPVRKEEKDV